MDTKKKELIGNYKNAGRELRSSGRPILVNTHDFPDKTLGKAVPYGVYGIAQDDGYVSVGVSGDTAQFAVAAIKSWWEHLGRQRSPEATTLTITADSGGSNSYRTRLWKTELQTGTGHPEQYGECIQYPLGSPRMTTDSKDDTASDRGRTTSRRRGRVVLVLTENWTITPPRDLRRLVDLAVEAERAGVDAVMLSEHIVLGPSAGAAGRMVNPREYALPGNQDPATPWPNSLMLISAIAAATTRLRLIAGAVIAPLRHPLLLARELGTADLLSEGRLVVLPTVSWHPEEYAALNVPFEQRGALLDEHLSAWQALWRDSPATFIGEHYAFTDIYLEPKAWRPEGPTLWFGGSRMHRALVRRIVAYGQGLNPLGPVSAEEMERLALAMSEAGRDVRELELVGGLRTDFAGPDAVGDLGLALERARAQAERGFTTFCFKPNQYIDDVNRWGELCREVVDGIQVLIGT